MKQRGAEKNYLAGALDIVTGRIWHCVWFRKVNGLFIDLLGLIESTYPASRYRHIYLVVGNYGIHKAKAVARWLAAHPRFELIFLPTYCLQANPIERAFGDVRNKCTRNHKRKRLRDLVADVRRNFRVNGPWQYQLSDLYYESEVSAAVEAMAAEKQLQAAA